MNEGSGPYILFHPPVYTRIPSKTHTHNPITRTTELKSQPRLKSFIIIYAISLADADDAASESGTGISGGEAELVSSFAEIVDVGVDDDRAPDDRLRSRE